MRGPSLHNKFRSTAGEPVQNEEYLVRGPSLHNKYWSTAGEPVQNEEYLVRGPFLHNKYWSTAEEPAKKKIYRGSYINAHVLLSLFYELGKIDKILSFCNELNKFNNTGARMLYSIYHMALKLLRNRIFGIKRITLPFLRNVKMDVIT